MVLHTSVASLWCSTVACILGWAPPHGAAQGHAPSVASLWCCTPRLPSAAPLSGTLIVVPHTSATSSWCYTVSSALGYIQCGAEQAPSAASSVLQSKHHRLPPACVYFPLLQFQVWKGPHTEEEYAHIN